jgi:hypothetical protein
LGQQIAQKQKHPVREVVEQVFGKAGTAIRHIALQAVTRFVPAVGNMIKAGFQKVGAVVAKGIKVAAPKVVPLFRKIIGI